MRDAARLSRRALLGAAACAALFAALAAPLISRAGVGHDEVWHAEPAITLIDPSAARTLDYWPAMPLMRDYYNGALKTYVLWAPFRLFGPSVGVLRATTLAVGALAVLVLTLLACRLHGLWLGLLLGGLLALDPALWVTAVFDTGPAVLMLLLKSCALWFLASWWQEGRRWTLFCAGLLLGLSLSDKAHFLWFLGALALAAVVCARDLRRKAGKAEAVLGALGFAVGAAPFLLFNIIHPLATFRDPDQLTPLAQHLPHLGAAAADRAHALWLAMTGESMYSMVADSPAPRVLALPLLALFGLAAITAAWAALRRGAGALKRCAFWLGLCAAAWAAAVLSPAPVKGHHLFVLYPLPHLAALAAFDAWLAASGSARRWAPAAAALLLLGAAARDFAAESRFERDLARTRGGVQFNADLPGLAAWAMAYHRAHPAASFFADDGVQSWLSLYDGGRLPTETLPAADSAAGQAAPFERLELAPEPVALLLAPRPYYAAARPSVEEAGLSLSPRFELALRGKPWIGAYAVGGTTCERFQESGRLFARGDAGGARRVFLRAQARLRPLALGPGFSAQPLDACLDAVLAGLPARAGELFAREASASRFLPVDAPMRDFLLVLARPRAPADELALLRAGHGPVSRLDEEAAADGVPVEAVIRRRRALELQGQGRLGDALARLDALVRLFPGAAALWNDKAVCEQLARRGDSAADARRAIALRPAFMPAYLTLADILETRGDPRGALAAYERGLRAAPADQPSLTAMARQERDRLRALLRGREASR